MLAQAVILCGGLGTRLGELTASTPKPMLPVAGRPFLDHLIQEVARYGFDRITLLAGRFGERIRDAYDGRLMFGARLDVEIEPRAMGTAGALGHAQEAGRLDPTFLVLNGDSFVAADLLAFVRRWDALRSADPALAALVLLRRVADVGRYGAVTLAGGRIVEFREKAAGREGTPGLVNAGVYVLDRSIVSDLFAQPASLESDILPPLAAAGRLSGLTAADGAYFIDIGIPADYQAAQQDLPARRTRPALFLDRDGTLNIDHGHTHRPQDLAWQPDAREAVRIANERGWFVFVVSNQAGVAHGYYDEAAVKAFHAAMQAELRAIGAHVDAFSYCPHHPSGAVAAYRLACRCRKPSAGMIEDLMAHWPVERTRSVLIGDAETDLQAAQAAGIAGLRYSGGSLADLVSGWIGG